MSPLETCSLFMKIIVISAALLVILAGYRVMPEDLSRFEFQQNLMGTRFQIVLYGDRRDRAEGAAGAAFARVDELNSRLSDYRDDSELNQLCRTAFDRPVAVSADLLRVLDLSRQWSELTDGAFDVTAAPVIRLWRRARRTRRIPDPGEIEIARQSSGYRKMIVDRRRKSVRLTGRGMQLDLGGIAKGYAADEALKILARAGFDRALVAAGGDVVTGEAPPGTRGWIVGVSPFSDRPPLTRLILRHSAVSTSGDAEQFVEIDGIRYSHIIDPRTGRALTGPRSVTVVSMRGAVSDPAATSLSVLDADRGLSLVDSKLGKFGPLAALYARKVDGQIVTRQSRNWRDLPRAE